MLLDECFMYDYGLVDATEEASDKKEVSDEMCEKALEVGAAELELEEAKADLKARPRKRWLARRGRCAKSCKTSIKLPQTLSRKRKKP